MRVAIAVIGDLHGVEATGQLAIDEVVFLEDDGHGAALKVGSVAVDYLVVAVRATADLSPLVGHDILRDEDVVAHGAQVGGHHKDNRSVIVIGGSLADSERSVGELEHAVGGNSVGFLQRGNAGVGVDLHVGAGAGGHEEGDGLAVEEDARAGDTSIKIRDPLAIGAELEGGVANDIAGSVGVISSSDELRDILAVGASSSADVKVHTILGIVGPSHQVVILFVAELNAAVVEVNREELLFASADIVEAELNTLVGVDVAVVAGPLKLTGVSPQSTGVISGSVHDVAVRIKYEGVDVANNKPLNLVLKPDVGNLQHSAVSQGDRDDLAALLGDGLNGANSGGGGVDVQAVGVSLSRAGGVEEHDRSLILDVANVGADIGAGNGVGGDVGSADRSGLLGSVNVTHAAIHGLEGHISGAGADGAVVNEISLVVGAGTNGQAGLGLRGSSSLIAGSDLVQLGRVGVLMALAAVAALVPVGISWHL